MRASATKIVLALLTAAALSADGSVSFAQYLHEAIANCGSEPTTIVISGSDGTTITAGCQNGKRHGLTTYWTDRGVRIMEERYDHGGLRWSRMWYEWGQPQNYGQYGEPDEWYYIGWDEEGRRISECGIPPADLPHDVPQSGEELTPPRILQKASQYIINKVGHQYFSANYVYDPAHSEFHREGKITWLNRYFVAFKYGPLTTIGADPIIRVEIYDTPGYVIRSTGAIVDEGKVVEPTVPREAAKRIAAEYFQFRSTDQIDARIVYAEPYLQPTDAKRWLWRISIIRPVPKAHDVFEETKITIDAVNGRFLGANSGTFVVCDPSRRRLSYRQAHR